jgi:hypothetical protein
MKPYAAVAFETQTSEKVNWQIRNNKVMSLRLLAEALLLLHSSPYRVWKISVIKVLLAGPMA